MSSAHFFLIHGLSKFLASLKARGYARKTNDRNGGGLVVYSKMKSGALIKFYSYVVSGPLAPALPVRVTYELIDHGLGLKNLADQLKALNARYRQTLPGWKTKRPAPKGVRDHRWKEVQAFLRKHASLISAFKYQGDDRLTEGNQAYNVQIASTPKEQAICFEFIKALVEAYSPLAIVRGRRQADQPSIERNGWIKRFAAIHRKRGWSARDIVHELQKELREGTWNRRSKVQYSLAPNTISKIAGIKLPPSS